MSKIVDYIISAVIVALAASIPTGFIMAFVTGNSTWMLMVLPIVIFL